MVSKGDRNSKTIPIAPGTVENMVADVLVLDYDSPESLEIIEAHAHELAAVLVEPVQSRRPDLQPKAFLQQLRQLTKDRGITLIFDEMITGFRIHPGGSQAWFGIEADLATYGKIVGGGMPIGVVAGKTAYMDSIDGGMWNYGDASYPQADTTFFAGTFCKHPLTMAAAKAVLAEIKREGVALQERLNQRTAQLANTLNTYFEAEQVPIKIVYFGSLFRFSFTGNMDLLFYHLLQKGVYIWEGRNCFLSAAHTDEDLDYLITALQESIEELREGGFLPQRLGKSSASKVQLVSSPKSDRALGANEANRIALTEAQKQLWVLTQIEEEGSLAYNVSISLQLQGSLNLAAMAKTVQEIVNRHESLRTTIDSEGNFQQILPSLTIDLPVIDFSDSQECDQKVTDWFKQEAQTNFDLTQGSLFRASLLKLEEQKHLLVLTAHHLVIDGWSMGIILQELATLYSAECQNQPCQLDSPLQFKEYVHWQQQQSQTEEMAAHESYWLAKFAGSIPVLDLPTSYPRPPIKTYSGSRERITLDKNLSRKIKQLSREKGCTLFMTLLSIYKVLLYRLTNQEELIVGIPAAGRSLNKSEGLVGYCTHLLPIRSNVEEKAIFSQYLTKIRGLLLDAYEHQDYPFASLLDRLELDRDPSRLPLITTTFNLEPPVTVPEIFALSTELFSQPVSFVDYDLSLNVTEMNESLIVDCDYNTDLFDRGSIEQILSNFQTLLENIVRDPEQPLCQIPLLTSTEQHQLLTEWNNTQTEYPQDRCIHQLFEQQVEMNPDAVAVVFEDQQLTYAELNVRANQLANYLQTIGVKTNSLVGISVERSLEMVIGLLGILKAGGAYLPLDPAYPQERLHWMLSDSQVEILLTTEKLATFLPEHQAKTIYLDKDEQDISLASQANPVSQVTPNDLAYVIYTSGSTGKPKGVLISHQSLVNHNSAIAKEYNLTAQDRVLQFASLSFDVAAEEIFPTWFVGATLVLRPQEMFSDWVDFSEFIAHNLLTVLNLPTPYWQEWTVEISQSNLTCPDSLRLVIVGSDRVKPEILAIWQQCIGNKVSWCNAYGLTETTITTTVYHPDLNREVAINNSVPIGRPIANTQIYILDSHLQPVPMGIPGELYISGVGLAQGYLNRPELTAEKFIDNPFSVNSFSPPASPASSAPSARLYKTGDLAKYLRDGNIEFIGRSDNQVKIRGFRIELGEIESVLNQHPQVREVVVVSLTDKANRPRLVAYLVANSELVPQELQLFLKNKLPDYMLPSAFIQLEKLPLTANGKIDRRALPVPDLSERNITTEAIAPRTLKEETLATLWTEVLNIEIVGIHDNFFELGGDSILAIQLIARAKQAGLQFTPKQLFQNPTIAELAGIASTTVSIQAEQNLVTGLVPFTPVQQWFFEQNFPHPEHYNQSVLLEVPSEMKTELLEQVVSKLLQHHDALRLGYSLSESGWPQTNGDVNEIVPVQEIDLSKLPVEQQQSTLEAIANDTQASLNLATGAIIKTVLFRLGQDRPARLLIVIHHLAVDGVSWRIILEDFSTAYQQLSRGETIQLPPKTTAFKHWAERLDEYKQSEKLDTELEYWLSQSDPKILPLPQDYSDDPEANTLASAERISISLTVEQTQALLQDVPSTYNTQINDVLLTALAQTLAHWTGERALLVDLESHGREELFEDIDLSRTVGWFTSVFPVLLELENIDDPGVSLKSIKEQLRLVPNLGIGYGILRHLHQDSATKLKL